MQQISIDQLSELFAAIGAAMEAHSEELCAMDANMGDGDLGLTMKKGFCAMPQLIADASAEPDLGKRLAKAGMKMTSVVPSTMGTLMASGIMGGGKAITGAQAIDAAALAKYLRGFADGIAKRGKCQPGDRTVLDAVLPAAEAAEKAAADGCDLPSVAKAANQGAQEGIEATKDMIPKYGKAAVFAAKAKGIADQGAYAAGIMIGAIESFIETN